MPTVGCGSSWRTRYLKNALVIDADRAGREPAAAAHIPGMNTSETARIGGGTGENLAMVCIGEPTDDSVPELVINGACLEKGMVGDRLVSELPDGTVAFDMEFYGRARFDWIQGERVSFTAVDADKDIEVFIQLVPRMDDAEFDAARIVPHSSRDGLNPPAVLLPAA